MNLLALLALPFLAPLAFNGPDTVSISLFTLFKPEMLQLRLASGDGALLDAEGLAGSRTISRGEQIRIRLSGNRLSLVVADSGGTIKQSVLTERIRIAPDDFAAIELIVPGKIKRTVRGTLRLDAGTSGRGPLRILLTTNRESAVASVVAAETSRREPAALMAIAVVVRTFMSSQAGRHSNEGFDFCDTTHCQFYRGEQDLSDNIATPLISRAVARTAGQILSYEGRPVEGYYTAACGGLLATPSMVWGGSTGYPYRRITCRWCQRSRFNRWRRSANADQILKSLSQFTASKLSPDCEIAINSDQPTGFVESVTLLDRGKRIVLSADSFRRAIGLRLGWSTVLSPTFTVERRGARFIFRGRGFGSQVGLCEEGAVAQAASGRSYREILSFYYPNADIAGAASHE
jgi:stage II sporulation protein D